MKAEVIAQWPGWISPNPIDPAAPLPGVQPLPPGASIDVVLDEQPNGQGWDLDKFGQLIGTGADLAGRVGVDLGPLSGFDFSAAFTKIAGFASTGFAVGGPIGAGIGAGLAVLLAVADVWRRFQDPEWYAVGPGVKQWATAYAQSAFVSEAQEQGTNAWPDVATIAKHQLAWWLERYGAVLSDQGGRFYSNTSDGVYIQAAGGFEAARALYSEAGVDYAATVNRRAAAQRYGAQDHVMQYGIEVKAGGPMVEVGGVVPVTVDPRVTPPSPGAGAAYDDVGAAPASVALAVGIGVGVAVAVARSSSSR